MNEPNWRAPTVPERDTLVFDEPGRVLHHHTAHRGKQAVCYSSFWYRVTRDNVTGALTLRVKHGGGEQSQPLGHDGDPLVCALASMVSDDRFRVLHEMRTQREDGMRLAEAKVCHEYRQAHADGRLKKRKVRGQSAVKVWIEPANAGASFLQAR